MKTGLSILVFVFFMSFPALACTIFTAAQGDLTLVGNNEDYWLDAYIWFMPATDDEHGRITFGWGNGWSQGGVNDQGLFFDWCALPQNDWQSSPDLLPYDGLVVRGWKQICETLLAKCSRVEEGVDLFMTYNVPSLGQSHILIADKTGNSAVVEWFDNKVTAIYKSGRYQVLTNFTLSDYLDSSSTPCSRYNTAKAMLEANGTITTSLFRDILNAVHQEPPGAYTVYSNVYDLTHGKIILYQHYNFVESLTLDVAEELEKGTRTFMVSDIFDNPSLLDGKTGVNIPPCPAEDEVVMVYNRDENSISVDLKPTGVERDIEFYDIYGRMIYRVKTGESRVVIPVIKPVPGVYLVKIGIPGGKNIVRKVYCSLQR